LSNGLATSRLGR